MDWYPPFLISQHSGNISQDLWSNSFLDSHLIENCMVNMSLTNIATEWTQLEQKAHDSTYRYAMEQPMANEEHTLKDKLSIGTLLLFTCSRSRTNVFAVERFVLPGWLECHTTTLANTCSTTVQPVYRDIYFLPVGSTVQTNCQYWLLIAEIMHHSEFPELGQFVALPTLDICGTCYIVHVFGFGHS